ncbi:hypothetical protein VCHA53O466_50057 [Vibrio chagasii]|nr:hypothetical protein VCHA53O466_50057 [Vibrio chagasii]
MSNISMTKQQGDSISRSYEIVLAESASVDKRINTWSFPVSVVINSFPYTSNGEDYVMENEIVITGSSGDVIYTGKVISDDEDPYKAEEEGKYNYQVQDFISIFGQEDGSVNDAEVGNIINTLFPSLVDTESDFEDFDCECCGYFSSGTVTLTHKVLSDAEVSYSYDGHFGYGYTPNLSDLISFAFTGEATDCYEEEY